MLFPFKVGMSSKGKFRLKEHDFDRCRHAN